MAYFNQTANSQGLHIDVTQNSGLTKNLHYNFHLINNDPVYPFDILGYLPEDLNMSGNANWESAAADIFSALDKLKAGAGQFSKGAGDFLDVGAGAFKEAAAIGANYFGINYSTDFFNSQIWKTTNPTSFNLRVYFEAFTDAKQEVWIPMNYLMGLLQPIAVNSSDTSTNVVGTAAAKLAGAVASFSQGTGLTAHILRPPGVVPALGGGKSNISIALGNMYYYDEVIIKSVSNLFHNRLDPTYGLPIAGISDLFIETRKMLTFQAFIISAQLPAPQAVSAAASPSS